MSSNAKTQTRQPSASRTRATRQPGRKGADKGVSLTSERIADDLAAFRKDGGKIEVLGNTRTFKNIGPMSASSKTAKEAKATAARKRA